MQCALLSEVAVCVCMCVCVCVCVCVCNSLTLAALEHPKIVPRVTLRDQLFTHIHLPFLEDLLVASGASEAKRNEWGSTNKGSEGGCTGVGEARVSECM